MAAQPYAASVAECSPTIPSVPAAARCSMMHACHRGRVRILAVGGHVAHVQQVRQLVRSPQSRFSELLPARTIVGVTLRGFRVEIDCVAVLPEQA